MGNNHQIVTGKESFLEIHHYLFTERNGCAFVYRLSSPTENHHAHAPVVPFKRHALIRRQQTKATGARQFIVSPGSRVEDLFMPHNMAQEFHVGKSLGPYGSLGEHGKVIIVTRISIGKRFLRRPEELRVKNRGLFPEGSLGEERDDGDITVRNQVGKFLHDKRADREIALRHKFRMSSQFQHNLGAT
jgi:hypothetical protein